MCTYLIISDQNNVKVDNKILKFLRNFHETFTTGFYYNEKAYGDTKTCVWYFFEDSAKLKKVFFDDFDFVLENSKYKIMASDGFFTCNCGDSDLPLIEDVWEDIGLPEYYHYNIDEQDLPF